MKTIYGVIIGIILAIALLVGGIFIGKYKFSTHEIQVVEKKIYETKWKTKIVYKDNKPEFTQENFGIAVACMESSIDFKDRTENNYLFVTAFDNCKENTARYEIGTKGNYKVYLAIAGIGVAGGAAAVYYLIR